MKFAEASYDASNSAKSRTAVRFRDMNALGRLIFFLNCDASKQHLIVSRRRQPMIVFTTKQSCGWKISTRVGGSLSDNSSAAETDQMPNNLLALGLLVGSALLLVVGEVGELVVITV